MTTYHAWRGSVLECNEHGAYKWFNDYTGTGIGYDIIKHTVRELPEVLQVVLEDIKRNKWLHLVRISTVVKYYNGWGIKICFYTRDNRLFRVILSDDKVCIMGGPEINTFIMYHDYNGECADFIDRVLDPILQAGPTL